MKKLHILIPSLVATVGMPFISLASCGGGGETPPEPDPEPEDIKEITIEDSKKTVSLCGETTFTITFNANWTIAESDSLTIKTIVVGETTTGHKVTLEYDALQSIGTQTIVCNATYSCDGEIQDFSNVLYDVEISDGDTNKTWKINGFKTNFEYIHGALTLNKPEQKDSHIYVIDQVVDLAFNLNGTEVLENDKVTVEFVGQKHSDNIDGLMIGTVRVQDGLLFIPTSIKIRDGAQIEDKDFASFEGINFICRNGNNIKWTQNLVDSFKITFEDILKDAIDMPEFEKQYLANLHETESNVQTYTIFYSADIEDPLNLSASIICHESDVAYWKTAIEEGGSIGEYNYVTLKVSFWSNEECTEKWNQDTTINFDIKIFDNNLWRYFTFEDYTFNYLVKRITEDSNRIYSWSCDPISFTTAATFAEGEDAVYAVPEFYNPSSSDVGGIITAQPFIEDGNIKFDAALTTKYEYGLKDDDSISFRMTFYCFNSTTEELKWIQTVDGYKMVFGEALILQNPTIHATRNAGKAVFKFNENSSVYGADIKELQIQNFSSDTITYERCEVKGYIDNYDVTVFFNIKGTLKPGDSAKFTIYINGKVFTSGPIFKKYYHNCEIVIDK